jgi:RNA polymerase sporulation-specific sigma factor
LIALWKAARMFDPDRGMKFSSFAHLCIDARFKDLLKQKGRYRHKTLDSTLRAIVVNGEVKEILEVLPHLHQVADIVEERDELRRLVAAILELTDLERRCVVGIATGFDYSEIGEEGPKQVDNALFRARKKLRARVRSDF